MKTTIFFIIVGMGILWAMGWNGYNILATGLFSYYAANLLTRLTKGLAFREFLLVLYGVNYLLSPALSYQFDLRTLGEPMQISCSYYFSMIIPAFLLLQAGVYSIPTKIFQIDFNLVKINAYLNERVLRTWFIAGVVCFFAKSFVGGELVFFLYLLSLIRYVAAFALFYLNKRKYWLYIVATLALEVYSSMLQGMFHDTMMWLIFFLLFLGLIYQYNFRQKALMAFATVSLFLFIQSIKTDYRNRIWNEGEEAGLSTFTISSTSQSNEIFDEDNLRGSIGRINQAWIFASTVENMDRTQDFQQMRNVAIYLESALLPRVLAPNKINSGDKTIFNRFSGHIINDNTSMGLGILADGYIAYGPWGVLLFAFSFGLLFGLIFKLIEGWTSISPFFVLFIFPILNYAVRPDCETQTTLGHMAKSVMAYGVIVFIYRRYFDKQITILTKTWRRERKPLHE